MEYKMEIGHSNSKLWDQLLSENSQHLAAIIDRVGPIRGMREVEFICEMPDRKSALEARKLLADIFSSRNDRHVYSMSTGDVHECKVVDVIDITPAEITAIEIRMLDVCRSLGGAEVNWGFDSTNLQA